ncbi:MAG: DUF2207 domain-containing protein [Patescibacteria group bacterium]
MKTFRLFSIAFLFVAGTVVLGFDAQAQELIDDFHSLIAISHDGTVTVTETITYDFGPFERHGIYRTIPYSYNRDGTKYKISVGILGVSDETGTAIPYTVERSFGAVNLKIGDPDKLITGQHTYAITYTLERVINFFEDYDELYLNITGNGWEVPMNAVSAAVEVPGVSAQNLQYTCFTGALGLQQQYCTMTAADGSVRFDVDGSLSAYEGLTAVVGFPKGVVAEPTADELIKRFIQDNWPFVLPLLLIGVLVSLWYTRGRDPHVASTIVPQYESPEGIPAGELGTVVDEKVDMHDVSASIIQLAVKGYIKLKEISKDEKARKPDDYEIIKLKEPDAVLKEYEKIILDGIFKSGETSKKISKLKNKFYVELPKIKKAMYKLVVADGFFPTAPDRVRTCYAVISIFILPLAFVIMAAFQNILAGISTGIVGIVAIILSQAMPRKTIRGAEIHKQILGFKWFLSVTETERLKFHNAPEKSPKQFEELLPYAMVLGVEDEWAKQFAGMYLTPPEWYEGHHAGAFGAAYLASSLHSLSTSTNSAMGSRPSSAGSGRSGFSGGGFSGGGFGGGGGGSW